MEKKFKNGLVLGKFYPPHLGHLHLIDTAAKQCEQVHLMVCSLQSEIIPGEYRHSWLYNHYKNSNVKVIHCGENLPQHPEECTDLDEFYNKYWVPTVYKYVKELDVVFTSEDYGDEFANFLGIQHVLVDKQRKTYPISGTKIREDVFSNWEFIPKFAKSYFMKRIVIIGPESTGKTTLTKMLSEHFNAEHTEEYGRTYTNITGTKNLTVEDFEKIAKGQFKDNFLDSKKDDTKLLFCDTEAITTKIFGEMYIDLDINDTIELIIFRQRFDLWLLLDVDVPWVNDGTRDFPDKRKWHIDRIKEELESKGIKYVLISGDYKQRFEKSIEEVNKIISNTNL